MADRPWGDTINACPNCGAHYGFPTGSFPLASISDTSYEQLRALFLKKLVDHYRCRACNEPLDVQPTVVITINERTEYLYCLSDRLIAAPDSIQKTFVDGLQLKGARVEAFATLDQLRVAYAKRIVSMVERILQGLEAVLGDINKFSAGDWRGFTSNYFTAALIALSTPLPHVTVDFPLGTEEEALNRIALLQAVVWLSLCNSWSGDIEESRTLEGDLNHYMAANAFFHKAADEFLRLTDATESLPPVVKFCLDAMRASLYFWSNKPNPQLREWAELFVEQEVERRILGEQSPPHLNAIEISAQRARDTIPYEALFDACHRQMQKRGIMIRSQLGEIGQKVGYPDLEEQLLSAVRFFPKADQALRVDELLEWLRDTWKGGPPEALLIVASKAIDLLGEKRSPDALGRVADGLKDILGNESWTRARIEAWLCSHLLKNGLPKAVLERIGDKAQPWERELTLHRRAALWTERSNALRMCGRGKEALAIAEAVIADLEAANDEPIPHSLRRNLGILYRGAGQHEQALEIFLKLLPDADRDLDLLHSIVVTYAAIGRIAESMPYLEAMLKLAQGPYAERRPVIIASLAGAKAAIGERHEALALLREIPIDKVDDVAVLVSYASAWVTLSDERYREQLEEEDRQNLNSLVTKLKVVNDATRKNGNILLNMQIGRLLAQLTDVTHVEHPNVYWKQVDVDSRKFEGIPDPMALLALTRDAWADGQHQRVRDYLLEVPTAVAKRYPWSATSHSKYNHSPGRARYSATS